MAGADLPFKMTATRRPIKFVEAELSAHIHRVGEITFAFTQLQAALFSIFYALLGMEHKLAHGIWHAIRNDSAQRDMLLAAAQAKLQKHKAILKQIQWVTACAQLLSSYRNDVTHTGLAVDFDEEAGEIYTIPDFMSGKAGSVKRLEETDPPVWKKVAGDLRALETYSRFIAARIMGGLGRKISGSWPRRPRLQSLVRAKASGRPTLRLPTSKEPPSQRPSWVRSGGKE